MTSPATPLPKQSLGAFQRPLIVLAGVVVFLVINFLFLVERCTTIELMVNCGGNSREHTYPVLIVLGAVISAAVLLPQGKSFAAGFFGALLASTVLTTGACTRAWSDPYTSARLTIHPYQVRRAARLKNESMRKAWIAAMNGRGMEVARGVMLTGAVANCAQWFATENGGRFPAAESELIERCKYLKDMSASLDPGQPVRYVISVPRGLDELGQTQEEVRGDDGWRVRYEPLPGGGFTVRSAPDAQLQHKWPVVHTDSTGRFEVQVSAESEPLALSPVGDLRMLRECLKGVPAEVERRRLQTGGLSYGWHLTSITRRLCPDLGKRLEPLIPTDSNATLLTVSVPAGPGGAPTPAAVYTVQFVIRQPANAPFAYDLLADATTAGLRHYLVTFEGSIHSTMEPRAATTADPMVDR